MRVADIRDRVVELGHATTTPDAELKTRALGWVNSAYRDVMDELTPYAPQVLQKVAEVVVASNGQFMLPEPASRVLAVYNAQTGERLSLSDPASVLALDPCGVETGVPARCYLVDALHGVVHPAGECTLKVLYVPVVPDLAEDGLSDSILLPEAHHMALVWGGLVWSSLFERGFASASELVLYQRQWEAAKERLKLALLGNVRPGLRVQPFVWVGDAPKEGQ